MMLPMFLADTFVSFPGMGIKDIPISRIAFQVGGFPVYWYGICIILAFGICVGLAMKQAKKFSLTSDDVIDFCLAIIPTAIIGARLYYIAFSWDTFAADPKLIFDIRSGGLAVFGGVILSFLAVFVLLKFKKLKPATVFDFFIVYVPLGQAIGRWGNFFNQEAFGTNTTLPWGMISSETSSYISAYSPSLNPDLPVHPTFLYESLATILIFVILLIARKRSRLPLGTVSMYFILYGIARFFIEGLRTDSLYIGNTGLRSSQVLSAILVVVGFGIIALGRYLGLKREVVPAAAQLEMTEDISSEYVSPEDQLSEEPVFENDEESVSNVQDHPDESRDIDEDENRGLDIDDDKDTAKDGEEKSSE